MDFRRVRLRSLRIDGFSWLFAGLVTGIGALVVLYARYYMSAEDPVPRFFAFLLALVGSMIGVVISGNLVQLAFFWALTRLFSFLLIGYSHHTVAARDGARMALTIPATGGDRKIVVSGKRVSVRIDLGVRSILKKQRAN